MCFPSNSAAPSPEPSALARMIMKPPLDGGIGVVKGAASALIASNQLLSAGLTPPGVPGLLIFCQKVKRTVIMLPFEIPSLHHHPHLPLFFLFFFFSAAEIRCISLGCMADDCGDTFSGNPFSF